MKKPWHIMEDAPKDGSWVLLVEKGKLTGHKGFRYVASYWDAKRNQGKGCWVDSGLTQVVPLAWTFIEPFK